MIAEINFYCVFISMAGQIKHKFKNYEGNSILLYKTLSDKHSVNSKFKLSIRSGFFFHTLFEVGISLLLAKSLFTVRVTKGAPELHLLLVSSS